MRGIIKVKQSRLSVDKLKISILRLTRQTDVLCLLSFQKETFYY